MPIQFPVTMRTAPSFSSAAANTFYAGSTPSAITYYTHWSYNSIAVIFTVSSATPGYSYFVQDLGSGASYLFFSAEL
jgi:hypothetical protein